MSTSGTCVGNCGTATGMPRSSRSAPSAIGSTMRSRLPNTSGLRWRLTAWVAGVLLVSAAVMFVVIYQDTGDQLRGQIDRDIAGDVSQLKQSLVTFRGDTPR